MKLAVSTVLMLFAIFGWEIKPERTLAQKKPEPDIFTSDVLNCHGWNTIGSSGQTYWLNGYTSGLYVGSNGGTSKNLASLFPYKLTERRDPANKVGEVAGRIDTYCSDASRSETSVTKALFEITADSEKP